MASCSAMRRRSYDVFLSFRGPDVRYSFIDHLNKALTDHAINTYIDTEDLRMGEQISPALIDAINESQIAIVIFSENYASSTWCLEELAKIMECKRQRGLTVIPVFYKVDPKEVRTPRDDQSYAQAMAKHADKFVNEPWKVNGWKKALFDAGSLSGEHVTEKTYEAELIQDIAQEISTILNRMPLEVAKYPVGIDSRVQELKAILNLQSKDDVLMVGLWGLGGVGKTTLAKAIYNVVFREFQGSSFLERVRENSKNSNDLISLQEKLLSEILPWKISRSSSVSGGSQLIRERLCTKRVLIILDDVDDERQLDALVGDCTWLSKGSRIIITTRDKHLLTRRGINYIYEVKALKATKAWKLLIKHAFPGNEEIKIRRDLVDSVLHYAKGLPLALEVVGSFLRGRGEDEWESTLRELAKCPKVGINDVLKVSYENLEKDHKEIFLDIACFFKGWRTLDIKKILDSCDFATTIGVRVLIERTLIKEVGDTLQMHDLIQLMGMDIVKEECHEDLAQQSRLWLYDDVLNVLSGDAEAHAIKAIVLKLPKPEKMHINPSAFKNMRKLRLLILHNVSNSSQDPIYLPSELRWLEWPRASTIRFSHGPEKLVALDLPNSKIEGVEEQFKDFKKLKFINLSGCQWLVHMPNLRLTTDLEELNLSGCKNLERVHESVTHLGQLRSLNLDGCSRLLSFPDVLQSKQLKSLTLANCSKLQSFPIIPNNTKWLRELDLKGTSIEELPASIGNLVYLENLNLTHCKELSILPSSIYRLKNLEELKLGGCSKLIEFPKKEIESDPLMKMGFPKLSSLYLQDCNLSEVEFLENPLCFPSLTDLYLGGNNFTDLPACRHLHNLKRLYVEQSNQLQEIHNIPKRLEAIKADDCKSLSKIPSDIGDVDIISFRSCHKLVSNVPTIYDLFKFEQFHPKTGRQVLLPGGQMPGWLLPTKEGYISFKATRYLYKKLLGLAFCVVFRAIEAEKSANFELQAYVDGKRTQKGSRTFSSVDLDHVWLECWDPKLLWEENLFAPNDWSHFQFVIRALDGGIVEKYGFRLLCMPLANNWEDFLHNNESLDPAFLYVVWHEDNQMSSEEESSSEIEDSLDGKTSTSSYLVDKGLGIADFSLERWLAHEENQTSTEDDISDISSETEDLLDSPTSKEKASSSKSLNKGSNVADFKIEEVRTKDESKEQELLIGNSYGKSPHAATEYLVGIDKQVKDMMDLLDLEVSDVRIVGIWGKDGVGKTTIAKVIYEQISSRFDSCSFLADIAATMKQLGGVRFLQSKLMSDILKQEYEVDHVAKGVNFFREVLRSMKVLIVLDNVEVRSHLHKIVGEKPDGFGYGSRIIVTTGIPFLPEFLSRGSAHLYEINTMKNDQALELFRKHALRRNLPISDFDEAAKDIINSVNGIPLLIEIIGSLSDRKLVEKLIARDESILQFVLCIQDILMVSFEKLSEVQREIFLDVACLPADVNCRIASFMWHNPHFPTYDGVHALHVKSLVKIGRNNELGMHGLLRKFGQQIIQTEDLIDPGRRGRLCNLELAWNTEKVEGTDQLNAEYFKSMPNIRFLILDHANVIGDFANVFWNLKWLQWQGCTGDFQATNFHVEKLVILDLSWSKVTEDWGGWREIKMPQLKVLNLTGCADLLISPDLSSFPDLEILILERCSQLIKLHPSIHHLNYLTSLNLRFCNELNMLPIELGYLKALRELLIDGTSVQEIPMSMGHMEQLEIFSASNCLQLSHLPDSLEGLTAISVLLLEHAKITQIPDSIGDLVKLRHLSLKDCRWIGSLPDSVRNLERLEQLDIAGTG